MNFGLINFYFYLLLIINILLTVLLYKSFRIINEFKKILIEFNDIQITNQKTNETIVNLLKLNLLNFL